MIESTFKGKVNLDVDVTTRNYSVKMSSLCRALDVADQQAMRVLKGLDEVTLIERKNGILTYRLDLKPLEEAESARAALKRINQQRTEKARQKKATQRAAKRRERILAEMQQFFRDLPEENRLRAAAVCAPTRPEAL